MILSGARETRQILIGTSFVKAPISYLRISLKCHCCGHIIAQALSFNWDGESVGHPDAVYDQLINQPMLDHAHAVHAGTTVNVQLKSDI